MRGILLVAWRAPGAGAQAECGVGQQVGSRSLSPRELLRRRGPLSSLGVAVPPTGTCPAYQDLGPHRWIVETIEDLVVPVSGVIEGLHPLGARCGVEAALHPRGRCCVAGSQQVGRDLRRGNRAPTCQQMVQDTAGLGVPALTLVVLHGLVDAVAEQLVSELRLARSGAADEVVEQVRPDLPEREIDHVCQHVETETWSEHGRRGQHGPRASVDSSQALPDEAAQAGWHVPIATRELGHEERVAAGPGDEPVIGVRHQAPDVVRRERSEGDPGALPKELGTQVLATGPAGVPSCRDHDDGKRAQLSAHVEQQSQGRGLGVVGVVEHHDPGRAGRGTQRLRDVLGQGTSGRFG